MLIQIHPGFNLMENNQQNFINQLNASWNAEPQTDKNIVSAAQGYQNNQNS